MTLASMKSRDRRRKHRAVYQLYGAQCVYCRRWLAYHMMTLDHVIPRSRARDNSIVNMVSSCEPCNTDRQTTPFEKYLSQLHHKCRQHAFTIRQSVLEKLAMPKQTNDKPLHIWKSTFREGRLVAITMLAADIPLVQGIGEANRLLAHESVTYTRLGDRFHSCGWGESLNAKQEQNVLVEGSDCITASLTAMSCYRRWGPKSNDDVLSD